MKKPLIAIGAFVLLGAVSVTGSIPAYAGNSSVETLFQDYGDLSMFYQGLLNAGVINELKENEHYTIFAPINTAFIRQISPQTYPCFYAVECRPQIAGLMRDHIVEGTHDLTNLVTYGNGIRTLGSRAAYVDEPFRHNYAVDHYDILSSTELNGNIVYRIDGVITTPQELAQFQTVQVVPAADVVTTEKTTIRKTHVAPSTASPAYPAGNMVPMEIAPQGSTETTTITHTYTTEQ